MRTTVLTLPILCLLMGCLPGSSPLRAQIEVRDAQTGTPVSATVYSRGGNLFLPPSEVMGPPIVAMATPPGDRVTTNAQGTAAITLAGARPNEVIVLADGYAPLHLVIQAGTASARGALDWSAGTQPATIGTTSQGPRLEARVRVD